MFHLHSPSSCQGTGWYRPSLLSQCAVVEGCSKRGGNHRELEPVQDERRNEASQIQVLWSCLVHQGPKNDASDASGDARAAGLWIYQNCRMIHMSTRIELSIFKVNWDCLILIWCYWSDKLLGINQLVLKGLKSVDSGESFKGLKVHSLRLLSTPVSTSVQGAIDQDPIDPEV